MYSAGSSRTRTAATSTLQEASVGRFDGKVAIVTGAGRGIGRSHALLLASEGAAVVVNDLGGSSGGEGNDATPAQQVVDEIAAKGGQAVRSEERRVGKECRSRW